MRCQAHATQIRLCQQCSNAIEEGRSRNQAPIAAKYCLACRAERSRRANLKYVWRPEYDELLKAHYYGGMKRRFQVLNRMIRETGLPRWYIKRRAARLGLTMRQEKRPWTPTEEETIARLVGKVSASTIARKLKRSEASVVTKIRRLNLSRRVRNGYTMRDLELCLGEDHRKIQRWIENGWLCDRLQGTRRSNGNGRDIHRFQEAAVLDFIRRHPQELNLGKVDSIWFLDLVLLKGKSLGDEPPARRTDESDDSSIDRLEEQTHAEC